MTRLFDGGDKSRPLMSCLLVLALVFTVFLPSLATADKDQALYLDRDLVVPGMDRAWGQGYAPQVQNDRMTVILPIRAEGIKGAVTATLTLPMGPDSPFREMTATKDLTGQKDLFVLRFSLSLHKDRWQGIYSATLSLSAQDEAGQKRETALPLLMRLSDAKPHPAPPALRLVSVTPQATLLPGREGHLSVTIKNPSDSQPATGITVALSDKTGDILPIASDTLSIDSLMPGEEQTLTLPITVLGEAAAKPHSLTAKTNWLDGAGKPREATESHTVTIDHQMKLAHTAPVLAARVAQGSMTDFSVTLMNMGDGGLRHVLLTFQLDGFASGQSVLVGEIPRDESRTAKAALTADNKTLGEVRGSVTVNYEDAYGRAGQFDIPLQTTIEERAPVKAPDEVKQEKGAQADPLMQYLPWGIAALFFIILVIQSLILRKRISKLEEEGL